MRLLAAARDANHYDISRDDRIIATLRLRAGGAGRIDLADGGAFLLRREDPHGVRYSVSRDAPAGEEPPTLILRAVRPNPLRRSYDVATGERHITLRAESPWRGDYLLTEGAATAGAIRPTAARSRAAAAIFPDDFSRDAAIALLCLVLALWRFGRARVDTL